MEKKNDELFVNLFTENKMCFLNGHVPMHHSLSKWATQR